MKRGREELADDSGDEERIRAAAVKIIDDVKLVSALSGPPLDDRASFLNVEINADELAEAREEVPDALKKLAWPTRRNTR